jgi:hypothetical protein
LENNPLPEQVIQHIHFMLRTSGYQGPVITTVPIPTEAEIARARYIEDMRSWGMPE